MCGEMTFNNTLHHFELTQQSWSTNTNVFFYTPNNCHNEVSKITIDLALQKCIFDQLPMSFYMIGGIYYTI